VADQPVLRVRGLRKRYHGRAAVDGIDFEVAPGERVALVGPNGAGKTTTLMSCLGAVMPDEGMIELLGRSTRRGRRAVLDRVGYAAGYLPLPTHLRVLEYLTLYGKLYGSRNPREHALAGLRRYGVERLARSMGTELSSGQRTPGRRREGHHARARPHRPRRADRVARPGRRTAGAQRTVRPVR
jgi:ABC-2 type transport system ATP-binding protein